MSTSKSVSKSKSKANSSSGGSSNGGANSNSDSFKVAERPLYETESFSPDVNAALNAVMPSEDPLDSPDFDPVAFINAKFSDENSLEGVGAYAAEVEERIVELDKDIYMAIREQVCVCVCVVCVSRVFVCVCVNIHGMHGMA